MDTEILKQHKAIMIMIYRFFDGSIRYEYLLDIILKTNYNNIKSVAAASRFFSTLKQAKILRELRDFDSKKRFYLNKSVIGYLKKVDYKQVSSVSKKTNTLILSNFKAIYFIEEYVDKNSNLSLPELIRQAGNGPGNLFNPKEALDRIIKAFGEENLHHFALRNIEKEKKLLEIKKQKQYESLKLGPEVRKKQAQLKQHNSDFDPYEEYFGDPILGDAVSKQEKTKVITLDSLKCNKVFLSDIIIEDIEVARPYTSSMETANKRTINYQTKFKHLTTKQVILKFVHFCSSIDTKVSKINTIYQDVQNYSGNFQAKNNLYYLLKDVEALNKHKFNHLTSQDLSQNLHELDFNLTQIVSVVVELDVIFMNKVNYDRVYKKLTNHKELTNQIQPVNYDPSTSYKINFRHYDIYPMNEHSPS